MVRIKLKDYKGEFVCAVDKFDAVEYLNVDEIKKIKEYNQEGICICGTKLGKVFDEDFIKNYLKDPFETYAESNGYDGMEYWMNFDGESWKKVEQSVREYFDSLGGANEVYFCDKSIIIEVDE